LEIFRVVVRDRGSAAQSPLKPKEITQMHSFVTRKSKYSNFDLETWSAVKNVGNLWPLARIHGAVKTTCVERHADQSVPPTVSLESRFMNPNFTYYISSELQGREEPVQPRRVGRLPVCEQAYRDCGKTSLTTDFHNRLYIPFGSTS
jgi:hypothetical protein